MVSILTSVPPGIIPEVEVQIVQRKIPLSLHWYDSGCEVALVPSQGIIIHWTSRKGVPRTTVVDGAALVSR